MSDAGAAQAELLLFRLAAFALNAAHRETGVAVTLQLRVDGPGELRIDIGFPEGTVNPDAQYQVLLRHVREYGDLFQAQHRVDALIEHGVPESQVAQERARWQGRLPKIDDDASTVETGQG